MTRQAPPTALSEPTSVRGSSMVCDTATSLTGLLGPVPVESCPALLDRCGLLQFRCGDEVRALADPDVVLGDPGLPVDRLGLRTPRVEPQPHAVELLRDILEDAEVRRGDVAGEQ